MKINPPKAVVDEQDPFKNALFGRKELADSLTNVLRNVSENLVVFVNAPWGAGKTTFSEMWRAYLRQQKLDVIYFDAYAADYFDDPFVSFSGEILELVDNRFAEGKGLAERQEFKKTAIEVGKRLAGLAVKVGFRAATMGAVEAVHLEELKDISSELASGVSEIGADVIGKKIENYATEKDALRSFKGSLAKLAAKVREEQGFPLTIIVDELDRCRPDFALGLLERIKHLFDVQAVAFVLLVNRNQIENYIQNVYGSSDAGVYLQKFGSLFVNLPNNQSEFAFRYEAGRQEYCNHLLSHYGLSKPAIDGQFLAKCIHIFANHLNLTLREVENVFVVVTVYYGSLGGTPGANVFLVAILSVLKVKEPVVYQRLGSGSVFIEQLLREIRFDQIKEEEGFSLRWAKSLLEYCLMPDAEFRNLPSDKRDELTEVRNWVGNRQREKIIPALCFRLDRFSLSPA